MKRTTMGCALTAVCLLGGAPASAITTYSYTGNNFTSIPSNDAAPAGTYTTGMGISGSFSVSAPLAAGSLASVVPSVLTWSFTDGRSVLTEANSDLQVFEIAIGAGGDVTEWRIIIQQPFPGSLQVGDQRLTILTQDYSSSNPDDSG